MFFLVSFGQPQHNPSGIALRAISNKAFYAVTHIRFKAELWVNLEIDPCIAHLCEQDKQLCLNYSSLLGSWCSLFHHDLDRPSL